MVGRRVRVGDEGELVESKLREKGKNEITSDIKRKDKLTVSS